MSPTIDDAHWHTLTIEEQFANIGSEVSRALNALASHNESRKNGAISRMIDLFSSSKRDIRWHHTGALTEICRASEVACDFLVGDNKYGSTPENLMKYFDHFAKVVLK